MSSRKKKAPPKRSTATPPRSSSYDYDYAGFGAGAAPDPEEEKKKYWDVIDHEFDGYVEPYKVPDKDEYGKLPHVDLLFMRSLSP